MEQKIISAENEYRQLDEWLRDNHCKRVFLVCDDSMRFQKALIAHLDALEKTGIILSYCSDFKPNPLYESVVEGVSLFRLQGCDAIIAVGGGSVMDVAKCVKLYSNMDGDGAEGGYLAQRIMPNEIPFLAMPTTAGTGSEATRYAVIYYKGQKQSITHESCIPGTVLLDPNCLKTLPLYQKKATMMDALCHAIESFWSVNSTEESRGYSHWAIKLVMDNMDGYLDNTDTGNAQMMMAAHIAGMAINITQTTAGHAMCYKITSLFGVAHGHAAILCNRVLFPWMIANVHRCIDRRGEAHLKSVFDGIADAMCCKNPDEAAQMLNDIFDKLELEVPAASDAEYEELKISVNPVRLKNHPVLLDETAIDELYHMILR